MQLTYEAQQEWEKHAVAAYPEESCGLLIGDKYIRCTNTAPNPTEQFRISARDVVEAELQLGPIQAILHSHPFSGSPQHPPEWPTSHDMDSWLKQSKPWGIVATGGDGITQPIWLDEANPEPLEGRQFIHGINDCYSLIRDYFKLERRIVLPNYARHMEWWYSGQDLYSENFAAAGFVEIKPSEVVAGDCCLFQVRSSVVNHAAVITGPNQILHHLIHRLSGYDQLSRWQRSITKYLRYQGTT